MRTVIQKLLRPNPSIDKQILYLHLRTAIPIPFSPASYFFNDCPSDRYVVKTAFTQITAPVMRGATLQEQTKANGLFPTVYKSVPPILLSAVGGAILITCIGILYPSHRMMNMYHYRSVRLAYLAKGPA